MKIINTRSGNNNSKKAEDTEAPVFAFGYVEAGKAEEKDSGDKQQTKNFRSGTN